MALVKKMIELKVMIAVEVDEDHIGSGNVADPWEVADAVSDGIQFMNDSGNGNLFRGGKVLAFETSVVDVTYDFFYIPSEETV